MTEPRFSRNGSNGRDSESSRSRAASFFKKKGNSSNVTTYEQMETDRLISETKIAKLRALRLAKEEIDRKTVLIPAKP
jgi:hypothetical protein